MNAIVKVSDDEAVFRAMQSSLYPGAATESIRMVLSYCQAAKLDPMTKPVHIVPIWDSKAKTMRDVVMPGIGLYRIQAARTGCAGVSEPEFGPTVSTSIGGQSVTFPEWCKVTVRRRLETGEIAEFTAKEIWLENYAIKGGQDKSIAPNAMWTKRPYGQLAKCAEAQALRKAFPEIGSAPTAEEMEGKSLYAESEAHIVQTIAPQPPAELLESAEKAADAGVNSYKAYWETLKPADRKLLQNHHDGLKAQARNADEKLAADAVAAEVAEGGE
jgi:phage recombination protein Bet